MNKIPAYNLTAFGQSLLDILIKAGVFAGLLLINFLTTALTNGVIQLPYTAITLPVLTLLLSQCDSYFVAWAEKDNVPVPSA
jgi:hypothetical protein